MMLPAAARSEAAAGGWDDSIFHNFRDRSRARDHRCNFAIRCRTAGGDAVSRLRCPPAGAAQGSIDIERRCASCAACADAQTSREADALIGVMRTALSPHPEELAKQASRRMRPAPGASWFETRFAPLTMRV